MAYSDMWDCQDKTEFWSKPPENILIVFLNPILHGAGHFVPRLVDYLAWRLSGRSDWAHISWLFFFQHLLCPIEAIFQKKFWKFEKSKKCFSTVPTSKGPPFEKKNWKLFSSNFCSKSYFFLPKSEFYMFLAFFWGI